MAPRPKYVIGIPIIDSDESILQLTYGHIRRVKVEVQNTMEMSV
jgi:hypothetical protein